MLAKTIAIIGGGNMGSSLLGGLIANHFPREKLWITDADEKKLASLKQQFSVHTSKNNREAVTDADVVLLAVKPQMLAEVASEIAAIISEKKPLVISIAAGVRVKTIQKYLGEIAIVRAMPNTPALIGAGATALFANSLVSKDERDTAESIMRSVSVVVWLQDEKLMDIVTALSGSGPAYFFIVMEALQKAAIDAGLPADTARLLTLQTAYGAARLALESDVDVVELRKRVTSPGGTTEAAIKELEKNLIHDIFKKALEAAKKRSEELG